MRVLISREQLQARVDELAAAIGPTTRASAPCWSASSRAPSSSWPTWPAAGLRPGDGVHGRVQLRLVDRESGVVRILKDLDMDIEGRHVLIVEDIIDSGLTLQYLTEEPEAPATPPAWRSSPCSASPAAGRPSSRAATRVSRSRTSSWWATAWTTPRSTATCRT